MFSPCVHFSKEFRNNTTRNPLDAEIDVNQTRTKLGGCVDAHVGAHSNEASIQLRDGNIYMLLRVLLASIKYCYYHYHRRRRRCCVRCFGLSVDCASDSCRQQRHMAMTTVRRAHNCSHNINLFIALRIFVIICSCCERFRDGKTRTNSSSLSLSLSLSSELVSCFLHWRQRNCMPYGLCEVSYRVFSFFAFRNFATAIGHWYVSH